MAFLALLALAAAAPSAPVPSPERAKLLAELAAKCRVAKDPSSDIAIVDYAGMVANELTAEKFCHGHDRGLALKLARMIADAPSPASGGAYGLLAAFYRGAHGMKSDAGLARFYSRRAWLLGSRLFQSPFKTPGEMRAYITDPETMAFLRHRLARGAPPRERIWLAEALLARRAAGDVEEARTLLRSAEAVSEPAARLVLAELALEPGASPADVADAATRLRPVAAAAADAGAKVRPVILRLARLQLAGARSREETWEAVQSLAAAAYAGETEPLTTFRTALLAANGGREPATVKGVAPRPRILDSDYPAGAAWKGVAGLVRLRALVDPRGRIVFTEAVDPAQPAILVDTVRRVYASRAVAPLAVAARPTPYVWVAVPAVSFRISDGCRLYDCVREPFECARQLSVKIPNI
jgi:hypothetical protein